ncbi:hypothetical protein FB451DRAFT_1173412 [Mycena latifolia]|nr:hypothetical protein FB451DRAFT_1173412 [Mycena latifolia]
MHLANARARYKVVSENEGLGSWQHNRRLTLHPLSGKAKKRGGKDRYACGKSSQSGAFQDPDTSCFNCNVGRKWIIALLHEECWPWSTVEMAKKNEKLVATSAIPRGYDSYPASTDYFGSPDPNAFGPISASYLAGDTPGNAPLTNIQRASRRQIIMQSRGGNRLVTIVMGIVVGEFQLICMLALGLPTGPVFTGVTGAANGTPSRPAEPLVDETHGTAVNGSRPEFISYLVAQSESETKKVLHNTP